MIFPDVIQESGRIRGTCPVSPATDRARDCYWHRSIRRSPNANRGSLPAARSRWWQDSFSSICAGLIGKVAAGHPNPLMSRDIKLPEVIKNRSGRRRAGVASAHRIKSKAPKKPNVTRRVGPEHGCLAPPWSSRSASLGYTAVISFLIGNIGIGRSDPRPLRLLLNSQRSFRRPVVPAESTP